MNSKHNEAFDEIECGEIIEHCPTHESDQQSTSDDSNRKNGKEDSIKSGSEELIYRLHDIPPWYTSLFLGLQQCFLAIGGLIGVPLVLANSLCMGTDDAGYLGRAMILNTLSFTCGIMTFVQTTFGSRLPILQGASYTFLPPALAILALPHNECPSGPINNGTNGTLLYNDTDGQTVSAEQMWMKRMREIQGAIIISSILEVVLGLTGAIGFLLRFIGPITIAPSITLIGLSLFNAASDSASTQWGVAFFTIVCLVVFSQYLRNVSLPLPFYTRRKKFHWVKTYFFQLYPVLIAVVLAWILCLILTETGVLTEDPEKPAYRARTDSRINVLLNSPWFKFPYPGQWGLPVVSAAGVVGMLAAIVTGIIESIGDYYACARLCGAPPVPTHAMNRGIFVEGIGCIVAGLLGAGAGLTSYSANIGAIAITRVASRRVLQVAGIVLFVLGMIGKIGAVLVIIPDPVIGGVFCVLFGMIASVGLSNLQHINLNSSRNLFILGFSLFMGLMVPIWVGANRSAISTGIIELDQIFLVLLETSIFIGGIIAAFLDNTIPGTLEERGMISWRKFSPTDHKDTAVVSSEDFEATQKKAYDLPFSTNWRFSKYIPILPEFTWSWRQK